MAAGLRARCRRRATGGARRMSSPGWRRVNVAAVSARRRRRRRSIPALFTTAMMRAAEAQGAELRLGRGHRPDPPRRGRASRGVEVEGETSRATRSSSPWGRGRSWRRGWLPLPPVFGLKGHSLVFETGASVPAEALFLEYQEPDGQRAFTRGVSARRRHDLCLRHLQREPVAGRSRGRDARPRRHRAARRPCAGGCRRRSARRRCSPRQACYRPVTRDGLPLIGPVAGVEGAYVATGHSVWGILNAPATGEAMAELILDGAARAVDLSPFDPARLRPGRAQ